MENELYLNFISYLKLLEFTTKINVLSEFNLCIVSTFHASQRVFLSFMYLVFILIDFQQEKHGFIIT